MANKRIDELTAATPLLTDFLPATPTSGPSTKATVKQLYDANLFAVSVAYTGTAPPPFGAMVAPKSGAQSYSTLTVPDGVTIENFVYSKGLSTTLTYANLAGIRSTFTMSAWVNLTSLSFSVLAFTGVNFNPNTMASLTTLSTPLLTYVGGSYAPDTMALLTTLSAPALAYVGGTYIPSGMALLTTLSAPALAYVGVDFNAFAMASLVTLSAPVLAYVGGNYNPQQMASLTTMSTPALAYVGGSYQPSSMAALTSISLPALTSVGVNLARTAYNLGRFIPQVASLTSVTLPAIEVIGVNVDSVNFASTPALTTFTLGSTLRRVEGNVTMTSCALLVASVDGLLVRLAALDGTGLTTAYSSKTVTITGTSATPSATGLAAKATLVARGCTVTHN